MLNLYPCHAMLMYDTDVFYSFGFSCSHPTGKSFSRRPGVFSTECVFQPPHLASLACSVGSDGYVRPGTLCNFDELP